MQKKKIISHVFGYIDANWHTSTKNNECTIKLFRLYESISN